MDIDTGLERKFARFGEGLEVHDGCVISGYASLFGAVDQGNDVVSEGAYAASLAALSAKGSMIRRSQLASGTRCVKTRWVFGSRGACWTVSHGDVKRRH